MTAQAVAHDRWCDGYGAAHSPTATREPDGTYRASCSAGCELAVIGTAGSVETARYMARRVDHPWGVFDVCSGGCV